MRHALFRSFTQPTKQLCLNVRAKASRENNNKIK